MTQDNILSDKSYKTYKRTSRYANLPYYYNRIDNKYLYINNVHLKDDTSFTLYTTSSNNETCDTIALKFYNNPTLYWIIADFNRIQDPYIKFAVGSKILVPNYSSIEFDM